MTPHEPILPPLREPDAIDLLMDEVVAELANQPLPADLQARLLTRLAHRSPTMQLVPAAAPSNVLHFQQLDRTGGRGMSPQSITVAALFNIAALLLIALQVHAVRTVVHQHETVAYVAPAEIPKPIQPLPRVVPPPPPIPKPVAQAEPKIKLPEMKLPEPVIAIAQPKPLPMVAPAPPRVVVAAAAPRPTAVNLAQSASVVNQDQHPSAVALGHPDNPIHPSNAPSTAAVNLGQRGMSGMPAASSGSGPASSRVNLGSGQPGGSIGGTGARAVAGVKLGVVGGTAGGTGNGVGTRPAQVALGNAPAALPGAAPVARTAAVNHAPQVLYKPTPAYTPEATALHVEGTVSVKIRVSAGGAVTVLGVTRGLGHGLDENAAKAAQAIRFKPATDQAGNPIDWEGVVNILFQTS